VLVAHRLQHEDASLEWMEGPTLNTKLVIGRSAWIASVMAILALRAVPASATPFDQTYYFNDQFSSDTGNQSPLESSIGATNWIDIAIADFTGTSLDVTAHEFTQADFATDPETAPRGSIPIRSGLNCLGSVSAMTTVNGPSNPDCVEYVVGPPNGTVTGPIQITISWGFDTNPTTTSPIIIQAEGSDPYSSELRNQTYFPCGLNDCIDPADTGSTDNFSRFTEAYDPVPEPSALMLLGSGLLSLGYRARRRFSR
jgi:hypothetical protein